MGKMGVMHCLLSTRDGLAPFVNGLSSSATVKVPGSFAVVLFLREHGIHFFRHSVMEAVFSQFLPSRFRPCF